VSFRLKKELELYKEEELELLRETLSSEIHSLQLVTMCFPNTMIEKGKRTKKWSFSLMLLMQSPYIPKELTKACKLFNLKKLLFFFCRSYHRRAFCVEAEGFSQISTYA